MPFPKESFTLFQVMSQYLLHSEQYFLDKLNKQNLERTAVEAIGMFLFDSLRPINNCFGSLLCLKTRTSLQRSSKGKYFNPLSVIIFLPASTRRNLKQETSTFSVPVICD